MSADRFEAVILDAHIAPGHDGAAELMVRLRYPTGPNKSSRSKRTSGSD